MKTPYSGNGKQPICHYNFKSKKYKYVYNVTIDDVEFWEVNMQDIPPGTYWSWHYYCKSEQECADEVYKKIKKYIKGVKRNNKYNNKKFNRHIIWQDWLMNYETLN